MASYLSISDGLIDSVSKMKPALREFEIYNFWFACTCLITPSTFIQSSGFILLINFFVIRYLLTPTMNITMERIIRIDPPTSPIRCKKIDQFDAPKLGIQKKARAGRQYSRI